jgi:hypothetical protein
MASSLFPLALLPLIALAGCSSSTESPAASTAPSTALPPMVPSAYREAREVARALHSAGIECARYEEIPDPSYAQTAGSCYVAGGEEILVSTFSGQGDAVGEPRRKAALLRGVADVHMVIGLRWTASCDTESLCRSVAAATGGSLIVIPA